MANRNIIDPVHGSIDISELESLIIDTPIFQRLRKIKQLGNVSLVFPGATHTRFSHSLGVMHIAGRIFDSLVKDYRETVPKEELHRIRQRIRLAALLHDIGHGPFSHQFETFIKKQELKISDLSEDLKIPSEWKKKSNDDDLLSHEDFSFGLINYLFKKLNIEKNNQIAAQDICSLLEDNFNPSESFNDDLRKISDGIKPSGDLNTLKDCFKCILSGEIDADRLDYLQRDSLFCGSKITGIDLDHILNSITLKTDSKNLYYIKLNSNAIGSIEQILISRKMMFDQVYTHHVNASFDELLVDLMSKYLNIEKPIQYSWYLNLYDSTIEDLILKKVTTKANLGEKDLKAKFFITRTTLKKVATRYVDTSNVENANYEMKEIWKVELKNRQLLEFSMKDFTKLERDRERGNHSIIKIDSPYEDKPPTSINIASEVLKSNLWRTNVTKLIVFEGLEESATQRNLDSKLDLLDLKSPIETTEKESDEQSQVKR